MTIAHKGTTRPPAGPSAEIIARMRRLEGGGLGTFVDEMPIVWERAQGCWIHDADGKAYIDLYGGFAVAAIGNSHPKVVEAIRQQSSVLMHCPSNQPSRVRAEFLEALASIAPPGIDQFLPAVTGAMANEMALSLARTLRGGEIITFSGSYFGRTLGVVGLAAKSRYREALGLAPAAHFVPYPYPLRMGKNATDVTMAVIEQLTEPGGGAGKIAAVMLEPIQGNGGVVIPPPDFLPRLRQFCDRAGALLIVDEIQSGFGRTGRMWSFEHTGVTPDLVTVGKGIGGGTAIGALMGRAEIMTSRPDSFTSTFLTNNLNLAASVAAIKVMREERLVERAARLGVPALAMLRDGLAGVAGVAEVRGLGLWLAIELAEPDGRPAAAKAARIVRMLAERGVIVGRGGHGDNVIKISPPLIIEEELLKRAFTHIVEAVAAGMSGTAPER